MEEGMNMTEFDYDCLQKAVVGRSARHRVRAGRTVTLPSDQLDDLALSLRNGPCRTYRLGRPMTLAEFEAMPEDLRRDYLRRLRKRGGSESDVERMLGIDRGLLRQYRVRFDRPDSAAWAAFVADRGEGA